MSTIETMNNFEKVMEKLLEKHATKLAGNQELVDWDAIYVDLLDEGYESADASLMLDSYIEENGY